MSTEKPGYKIELPPQELNRIGYEIAMGAFRALFTVVLLGLLVTFAFSLCRLGFGWGEDDSDNGWRRSGMKIHTDHKTGVQYFSVGGALTPRLNTNGLPLLK